MPKIDRSDIQILAALQSNARQTNRAIAEEVGLAQSTTLDRIRSLEERGVVTGYHADIDLTALGRPIQAIVTLRLRPKTGPVIDRAIEQLMALVETLGVFLVTGIDDVIVHLSVPDWIESPVLRVSLAIGPRWFSNTDKRGLSKYWPTDAPKPDLSEPTWH